ncbi:MAG: RNA polymerase sigma factor [Clostridia bacterium]|nr:RNA polymerase sigma factor [Clostridia bacterium]
MGLFPKPERDITEVYNKYSDMLFRISLMQLGNKDDAMDAVQDVFLKYMDKTVLFFSDEHEKAWFIKATVNRCHDIYRKNSVRAHEDLSEAHNVSYKEHFGEDNISILEAVEKLPEKIKTVVILHYLEGFSVEETAKMLKISASAVKMRLSRGRDALKILLEKEEFNA